MRCRHRPHLYPVSGGFKLKTLNYIFNRVPIAAIRGSIAGLPLTPGCRGLPTALFRHIAAALMPAEP
jgi:hypothetical protein